jgi:Uma2 family endonuclease
VSVILDEPKVRLAVYPLSVGFYHQAGELGLIGEDVELLDGTLVRKMPKSPRHAWLVEFLFELLNRRLPAGFRVRLEQPLTLATSEPEPDLAVVRGTRDDFRRAHPPTAELVIEVAVSTLEVDRLKAGLYAAAGVNEYWIMVPELGCVEVFRHPTPAGYQQRETVRPPAVLSPLVLADWEVPLAELLAAD